MAIDRQQKKKNKRDQKRKDRTQDRQRRLRREKAEFEADMAAEEFYYENYSTALKFALKSLKVIPNRKIIKIAIDSAREIEDTATLYTLCKAYWNQNLFFGRQEFIDLIKMSTNHHDYELTLQVCQALKKNRIPLERPLTKAQLKNIDTFQDYANLMLETSKLVANIEKKSHPQKQSKEKPKLVDEKSKSVSVLPKKNKPQPGSIEEPVAVETTVPEVQLEPQVQFQLDGSPVLEAIDKSRYSVFGNFDLTLQAYKLSFRTSYDQLICLPVIQNIQSLWYQEETARKVMKMFRGRAILADEVGLGKTIEAGLVLKEYLMRGLVQSALILTPSSLVNQWKAELQEKFQISVVTTNDSFLQTNPALFWNSPFILASINTAKSSRNFDAVTSRSYDLVIVDEAHHLKNRTTLNWKLVNAIQKNFLLLLTATPVENNLEELYNLVTLLRPGHLKTRKSFKAEFVSRGNPTDPQNREKLRQLLKEVMLRNTRSITRLHLPPRFATTVKVSPSEAEQDFYDVLSQFISQKSKNSNPSFTRHTLQHLLGAAGSSHSAALKMLEKLAAKPQNGAISQIKRLIKLGHKIKIGTKTKQVIEFLKAERNQTIVFVNYVATLTNLHDVMEAQKIPHVIFQGSMDKKQKQASLNAFKDGCQVLLATGSGGEGHNLQFCQNMINFDLPWNPMEIEQRIGRIHRIGQKKEVQIYNFCASGSIEDHVLEVLDRKINMFELVIGEIDMILGRMRGDQEFSHLVYELWIQNDDPKQRGKAFDGLATRLKRLRTGYENSKELDEKLFQEDFGV